MLWIASSQSAGPTLGAAQTEHVGVTAHLRCLTPAQVKHAPNMKVDTFMTESLTALRAKRLEGPTLGSQFCECMSVALCHTLSMHACSKRECGVLSTAQQCQRYSTTTEGNCQCMERSMPRQLGGCGSESAGNFKVTALGSHLGLPRSRGHIRIRCARSSNSTHQVLFHGGQRSAAS